MLQGALDVVVVLVLVGMVVVHVLALRGAARLLRLPVGRVFLRAGAPLPRALLAGLAGPLVQLVVAVLLLTVTYKLDGVPRSDSPVVVQSVVPGKPADGKLERHDLLLSVDDQPISEARPFAMLVQGGKGAPVKVGLRRDGKTMDASITPELSGGQYRIGVMLLPAMQSVSVGGALGFASRMTFERLGRLAGAFAEKLSGRQPVALSGPVGIISAVPQVAHSAATFFAMCSLLVLILGLLLLLFDAAWMFVRGQPKPSRPAHA
jgi:regulator of sigma E protease